MPDESFEWGKATITVRATTGMDTMDARVYYRWLGNHLRAEQNATELDPVHVNRVMQVTDMILRSKVDGEFDHAWPNGKTLTEADAIAAYEGMSEWPGALFVLWLQALQDADLTPATDPKAKKKPKKASTTS
jgi:hypothetical protein